VTVLHVVGELDVLTVPRMAECLARLVREDQDGLVLDLGQTEFIDSVGLHVLLNTRRRLTRRRRRFGVICQEGQVRHAIGLARLGETLGLVSSWKEFQQTTVL
jgi:anti-sigma B factor antagonist